MIQIDVDIDKVTIAKQIINRPEYISRSEWLEFWEERKDPPGELIECEICGDQVWTG